MTIPCVRRTTCRICGASDLELVLPLTPTPIASSFLPKPELLPVYPLDVALCRRCGLVQLLDTVDPIALYSQATERTARDSPGMREHFQRLADGLERFRPTPTANGRPPAVVEIGSNDGCLLRALKGRGWRVIGIDPCEAAAPDGIETIAKMFTASVARRFMDRADLIVANNVMANVDDLNDFAEGIKRLLAPDGVFVFETGYLGSLVEHLVFDNIYHEHLSYFSVAPLIHLFAHHGLELFDVEVVNTKGGSLRGFVQHVRGPRPHTTNAVALMAKEEQQELLNPWTYRTMNQRLTRLRHNLGDVLKALDREWQLIGYGASHSVVTLLHHLDIARFLEFVVDDNPVKRGLLTPGHQLEIRAPVALTSHAYTVILPWRFADQIMAKNQRYMELGGRFLVPVPEVRIV
jgi:SAM-dependent methyltransferase